MEWTDGPIWSVCKLGPNRYFYAAWTSLGSRMEGDTALATGEASTVDAAEQAAREAAGPTSRKVANGYAAHEHRKIAAAKRSQSYANKPKTTAGAASVEFLYEEFYSNEDCVYRYYPHRVIKRTAKRIFIDARSYSEEREGIRAAWYADHSEDLHTIALDREAIDQTGKASTGTGWTRTTFYVTPPEHVSHVPPCFAVLDLAPPCTVADVKRAYKRKARELHPDNGGDNEAFIALQHAYEQALQASSR
ncbi:MAG: J domain-containing protein [Chloroflexota bacterium]|nr:J domain-containing protein [Chloroflexota bacterium]